MDPKYTYYAFVSYRSSDERWAKWVQEKIEGYRLPAVIAAKNEQLPQKQLRPCFRYHTDIQPNELKTELRNKLEQSKYLLVICSPRSAASPWVGNEIETFIEMGRKNYIIPIIVEGKPYSNNPETECLHPVILKHFPHSDNLAEDHEILGVNVNEEGAGSHYMKRERAIIQIVSRMLGVGFDVLWNRQRRRIIRQWISIAVGAILMVAAIVLTVYWSRPVPVAIQMDDQGSMYASLPARQQVVVSLEMADEVKTDTLDVGENEIVFPNIPKHYLGESVTIRLSAADYLPLDTTIVLREHIQLPLYRDAARYGHLQATLFAGGAARANEIISIGLADGTTMQIQTDANGRFCVDIPLSQQASTYPISSRLALVVDTLYAPCGENDIIY